MDLTLLMAEEKGMIVDQEGYDASMAEQMVSPQRIWHIQESQGQILVLAFR